MALNPGDLSPIASIDSVGSANVPVEAAKDYALRGWKIFPVYEISSSGSCSCLDLNCSSPGKHPRTPHGVKDATADLATIGHWWQQWPCANIGVATGAASGIFVLDVDGDEGSRSIEQLEAEHGEFPDTLVAKTGGGGWHAYFKHPGVQIKNSVKELGPGLDVRGDGGYVLGPPSRHLSGRSYQWVDLYLSRIADAPSWLISRVKKQSASPKADNLESTWRPPEVDGISREEIEDRLLSTERPEFKAATERMFRGEPLFETGSHHASIFAYVQHKRWALPEISDATILKTLEPAVAAMNCPKHGMNYVRECLAKANTAWGLELAKRERFVETLVGRRKPTPSKIEMLNILTSVPGIDQRAKRCEKFVRHFVRKYRGPERIAVELASLWNRSCCSPPLTDDEFYGVVERVLLDETSPTREASHV